MQSEKRFSTQLYSSGIPISIYNGIPIVEETIRLGTAPPTTTTTLKNNWFYKQNYSPARISHLNYIYFTSTARLRFETSQCNQAMNNVHEFSFLFLKLDKVLKNSTPRESAYI